MRQVSKFVIVTMVIAGLLGSGCASVFQGTQEQVAVNSDTPGARVRLNGSDMGMAPVSLNVKRNEPMIVTVSARGYQPQIVNDQASIQWGYMVLDAVLTGWIGVAVDLIDGAGFQHDQPVITAHLEPAMIPDLPRTAIAQ